MKQKRGKILTPDFFLRTAPEVARDLLGKFLVRHLGNKECALVITETEAYDGFEDRASHASRGKTLRNAPMFEAGGIWYVYFVYGMHEMLNIVTGPKDYPSAVLLRGAGEISGPARLTKHFEVGRDFNTLPASLESGLWIEDRGVEVSKDREVLTTPRIGVSYAGAEWADMPWRFVLKDGK